MQCALNLAGPVKEMTRGESAMTGSQNDMTAGCCSHVSGLIFFGRQAFSSSNAAVWPVPA